MTERLNDPAIIVNNKETLFVPASLVSNPGIGEVKVEMMSKGAGVVEPVTSVDVSTKMGTVKFEVPHTIENAKLVKGWQRNVGKNTIEIPAEASGKVSTEYYQQASVTNKPDYEYKPDGKIAVEFGGMPGE